MSEQRSVQTLFEYAIAAEHYAEEAYRTFARMFAVDPRVVAFWQRYAAEELGHATWLERVLAKLPPETRDAPADFNKLETARHMIKIPLAEVLAEVETLDEAYQLANELESSEVNTIFEFLLSTFSTDPQATEFALNQLSDHATRLFEEFPAPYTDVPHRRALHAG